MKRAPSPMTPDVDVLIIGAGLSGIGCAVALKRDMPELTFAIVEARDKIGGTWDLFRYPGIRSDSDLYTFSYAFKPWTKPHAIASGGDILDYLQETVDEHDLERQISYRHEVVSANWNSEDQLWHVTARPVGPNTLDAEDQVWICRWVFGATGYYDYASGHAPHFANQEAYRGQIVHPQDWPEDLNYAGKTVVIIGSGATAVTLLPEMAKTAGHVIQVQRTPTYIVARPKIDRLARLTKKILPPLTAHRITRLRYIAFQRYTFLFCQKYPTLARRLIRNAARRRLPKDYPVDVDFNPPYAPWDQRVCAAPDGDFFQTLSEGAASIRTGEISQFTKRGLTLQTGEEIEADIIVTATGLKLKLFGNIDLRVDGVAVDTSQRFVYKGLMLDGVPNFCFAVGYTNSSWTLKVGLLTTHFTRLLSHMRDKGLTTCTAQRPADAMQGRPLLDFGAGYVQRAIPTLPKQGDRYPWLMTFSYFADSKLFRRGRVDEAELRFSGPGAAK